MKKAASILGTLFVGMLFAGGLLAPQAFAHGPQGEPGQGYVGSMMGSGMMGGGMGGGMMGQGMSRGMTGQGYEHRYGHQSRQPQKSLNLKDARTLLEDYLKSTRNPNLKLGTIEDVGSAFEAEILTKENSLVDKVAVNKETGQIRSIY